MSGERATAERRRLGLLDHELDDRGLVEIRVGAGCLLPTTLRPLDAIHLATAQELGADLARVVTYDERMAAAADVMGYSVAAPA